jgi:DNA-binding SARP family transcriptional activator
VHVLSPELSVSVDGERVPAPRGFPAKLLALLIAADGSLTVDAAIEGLWPGADPDVGRNRLHGVLLRLRRGLGLPAGVPISCTDDVVRLAATPHVEIDSWEFAQRAALAGTRKEMAATAVIAYTGDVLAVQYAYDDTIEAYRRSLRRTFLGLAATVLADPAPGIEPCDLAAVARRAALLAPEDDTLCLAAAATLRRLGHHAEARQLVEDTARVLDDLGLDSDELRRLAGLPARFCS